MRRHSMAKGVLGLLGIVILITGFAAGLYYIDHRGDGEETQKSTQKKVYLDYYDKKYYITHNLETYLLIGTDDTGVAKTKKTGKYQGAMCDFLLLFVMDKTDGKYGFLQIDRNTVTDVHLLDEDGEDAAWDEEQICTAHWYGTSEEQSCENTVETVTDFLWDLPIDGYYSINMADVKLLNQAIGGVRLTIREDLTKVDPAFVKGATLTLTDDQAEKFVRARMNVGEGTNAQRMERQKQFMEAFKSQVKERTQTDPSFINDLFTMLRDEAVTDIPGNRISEIANFLYKYKGNDRGIFQFKGKTKLGKVLGDGKLHEEFYVDEDNTIEVLKELCGIEE